MRTPSGSNPKAKRTYPSIRPGALSIRVLLAALALLPLGGALWFAVGQIGQTGGARNEAALIEESARELVLLTNLRARLLDERDWVAATRGIVDAELTLELVNDITGIDIAAQQDRASKAVDELLVELDDGALADSVSSVRSGDYVDLIEVNESYSSVEEGVGMRSELVLQDLLNMAGDLNGGSAVVDSLRDLELAAQARQAVAAQLTGYYGAQMSAVSEQSVNLKGLIEAQTSYDEAVEELRRSSVSDSRTRGAVAVMLNTPEPVEFDAAMEEMIDNSLSAGLDEEVGSFTEAIIGDLDEVVRVFELGASSADTHLFIVNAAGEDVAAASQRLGEAARRATDEATRTIVVVVIASLIFAGLMTHSIGAPLRRLAIAAGRLRDGEDIGRSKVSGSREVREAISAIDEAAAHIRLAERQANALANGDLNHPALSETAPGELGASLQNAVRTLAGSLGESEEFKRRLAHEAAHDGLTELPNRRASLARLRRGLARTARAGTGVAVMFIDLDDFKEVNDYLGHQVGDQVLQVVGARLRRATRSGDHVGRLGGDEFLVVAEPVGSIDEIQELAERILVEVGEPIWIDNNVIEVNTSIGIAMSDIDSVMSADELLRDADLAVYRAKAMGRGRFAFCDDELRAELSHQVQTEKQLRAAIDRGELKLVYQPVVSSDTYRLVGIETLVRWVTSDGELVSPDDFIQVAERSDLIVELDKWVIDNAVAQLARWERDPVLVCPRVAVNVSGRHLQADGFAHYILDSLSRNEVDGRLLVIEVTESALPSDMAGAARELQKLRDNGVAVAIDDFGTGYTSLSTLRELPADILKVDKSFIADEGAVSLVQLLIDTGHLLGMRIVAEGIETSVQAERMAALGCDSLQGFYFGRPSTVAEIEPVILRAMVPALRADITGAA